MNEDAKLNDFLKERLEAGVSGLVRPHAGRAFACGAGCWPLHPWRRFVSLPCISGFHQPRRLCRIR